MRRNRPYTDSNASGPLTREEFQNVLAAEIKAWRLEMRFYIFTITIVMLAHISGFTIPIKAVLGAVHL